VNSVKKTTNNSALWDEASALFLRLLDFPPEIRAKMLQAETQGKLELLHEVKSLLSAYTESDPFLETPATLSLVEGNFPARREIFQSDETILDFKIIRVLGTGAFATVYLARQLSLDREVALKVSLPRGKEGRTMALLEHANITQVFSEVDDPQRKLRLIAMQYVPGPTLEQYVKLHRPTLLFILDLGSQIAEALAYAHARQVLHLDVKPANILIGRGGRPLLTDFNVAMDRHPMREANHHQFGGTFEYMAPEQREVFGAEDPSRAIQAIDQRADIFSLGVVIRELTQSADLIPADSPELWAVIDRATDANPGRRFPVAIAMANCLKACLEGEKIKTALPPAGILTRLALKHPLTTLTAGNAVLQLLASAVSVIYNYERIVSHLSASQMQLFTHLLQIYHPVVFSVAPVLWLQQVLPLYRYERESRKVKFSSAEVTGLRLRVLRLPKLVALFAIATWMPGSVLFPCILHFWGGGITATIFGHFLLSFTLSCLVALSCSCLFAQFITLRVLYPRFWANAPAIHRTARVELAHSGARARLFQLWAGAIPLAAVTLIVALGPEQWSQPHYRAFAGLVSLLSLLAIGGQLFGLAAGYVLQQTIAALTLTTQLTPELPD